MELLKMFNPTLKRNKIVYLLFNVGLNIEKEINYFIPFNCGD